LGSAGLANEKAPDRRKSRDFEPTCRPSPREERGGIFLGEIVVPNVAAGFGDQFGGSVFN
jgi:hypothetical protein